MQYEQLPQHLCAGLTVVIGPSFLRIVGAVVGVGVGASVGWRVGMTVRTLSRSLVYVSGPLVVASFCGLRHGPE